MNIVVFWGILILVFLGLAIGIPYLIYFVIKAIGFRKTGIIIGVSTFLFFCSSTVYIFYEDYFFFNYSAKKELKDLDIYLRDDFEILENESGGFTDYYHIFKLKISENDMKRLISQETITNDLVVIKHIDIDLNSYKEVQVNTNSNTLVFEYVIN